MKYTDKQIILAALEVVMDYYTEDDDVMDRPRFEQDLSHTKDGESLGGRFVIDVADNDGYAAQVMLGNWVAHPDAAQVQLCVHMLCDYIDNNMNPSQP